VGQVKKKEGMKSNSCSKEKQSGQLQESRHAH